MAFVAVAMARTGHRPDALRMLTFLQGVQSADGGFEARYRLDGSGPPDDRPRQSDGAGWALWAMGEVLRAGTTPAGCGRPAPAAAAAGPQHVVRAAARGRRPAAAAPVPGLLGGARRPHQPRHGRPHLAGLQASARLYDALGRIADARGPGPARPGSPASCGGRFAADGYQRFGRYGGRDGAVTFLMPPFADQPGPGCRPRVGAVPARGAAPRGRSRAGCAVEEGRRLLDAGDRRWSPTPPPSPGRPEVARHWLDWLQAHATTWGSLPEKVLSDGSPVGPAAAGLERGGGRARGDPPGGGRARGDQVSGAGGRPGAAGTA